jgi:hypothetical protein
MVAGSAYTPLFAVCAMREAGPRSSGKVAADASAVTLTQTTSPVQHCVGAHTSDSTRCMRQARGAAASPCSLAGHNPSHLRTEESQKRAFALGDAKLRIATPAIFNILRFSQSGRELAPPDVRNKPRMEANSTAGSPEEESRDFR